MYYLLSYYLLMLSIIFFFLTIKILIMKISMLIEWLMFLFLSMKIEYIFYIDWITLMFISVIFLISSMVIMYSLNYMENDFFINRFILLILIFVISMILMIISPNMFSILLGWDGLGLSSYCLVIYYQNLKSYNSGMVTLLMNRIGDIFILLMISNMLINMTWNFMFMKYLPSYIIFFLMIASFTKSAQIPFSTWLPLAMAAPTPISSLVHSSTLVTAGVYLLIRFYNLINYNMLFYLMIISCMTMFFSGVSANFEYDIKKIIALSTLSQLGLMIFTISLNLPMLAFFHLITHAMFKSLLFLCSGIIIHNYMNHQDIRFISFLNLNMPFINMTMNISAMTLCGMPFLTGFYSKDLIIEMFNMKYNNIMMSIMMYMSMMLTLMYTLRMLYYMSIKSLKIYNFNIFKLKNKMNYSILILLMMSMFYGSILNWLIFNSMNFIFLKLKLKLLIYIYLFIAIIIIIFSMSKKNKLMKNMTYFYTLFNWMWFLPFILKKNKMNLLLINNKLIYLKDFGWLEYLSFNKILFMMYDFNKMKLIYKLNFTLIMLMIIYMIMIMLFM